MIMPAILKHPLKGLEAETRSPENRETEVIEDSDWPYRVPVY